MRTCAVNQHLLFLLSTAKIDASLPLAERASGTKSQQPWCSCPLPLCSLPHFPAPTTWQRAVGKCLGFGCASQPQGLGEGGSDTRRVWAGSCGAALLPSPSGTSVWEEEGARTPVAALLLGWKVELDGQGRCVWAEELVAGCFVPCPGLGRLQGSKLFAQSAKEQLLRVVSFGSGEYFPSQFLPPAYEESWNHRIIWAGKYL